MYLNEPKVSTGSPLKKPGNFPQVLMIWIPQIS